MPRKIAPRQKISYGWLRGEDYWGDPMSDNMVYTDAMLHPAPKSMTLGTPPLVAEDGDQYIIPMGAGGEWADRALSLTMRVAGKWVYFKPFYGLRALVEDYTFVWFDGTAWVPEPSVASSPEKATRYDVAVSVGYVPESQETLLMLPIVEPMRLDKGATLSLATATTPPTALAQLLIYRNSNQVGTVVFNPSSFNGTFLVPVDTTFGIGDRLRVVTSAGFPQSFGDFGMVIRMSLLN